jgi:hypothetical protein
VVVKRDIQEGERNRRKRERGSGGVGGRFRKREKLRHHLTLQSNSMISM